VLGHADGAIRFINEKTVFINDYSKVNPAYGRKLKNKLRKANLDWVEFPYVQINAASNGIPSAAGCYINYLQAKGVIIMPGFCMPEDETARRILTQIFPEYSILMTDCIKLSQEGGVLNCVSWGMV
jgi:agmatine deiminase